MDIMQNTTRRRGPAFATRPTSRVGLIAAQPLRWGLIVIWFTFMMLSHVLYGLSLVAIGGLEKLAERTSSARA